MLPAIREIDRLVSTANAPDMAMPCPARPSLTPKSLAIGVSRLTGMNSEAINAKTHSVIAKTPPHSAAGASAAPCLAALLKEVFVVDAVMQYAFGMESGGS